MGVYRYFPVASDRMGMLWTLSTIKDAYIIEYGPAGTTHFAIEGLMQLNADTEANNYTTHIQETDIAFGSHERLEKAILEIDNIYEPKYIFVMASSISATIGIDIESVCFMLQEKVKTHLIAIDTGGFKGDYTLGVRNGIKLLCSEVVKESELKTQGTYNIIGNQVDYFNFSSDLLEMKNIMKECFGYTCNMVFTANTSIDEIENASQAEFNLVIRSEGIDGAKVLQKKFRQPYIEGRPYGIKNTIEWINKVAKVTEKKPNENYIEEMRNYCLKALMDTKRSVKSKELKGAVVAGNYDLVIGITELFKELGIEEIKGIINHKLKGKNYINLDENSEENLMINPSEEEKIGYIDDSCNQIVFGDAPLLKMLNNTLKVQVSNPNLGKKTFYNKTPFVGFNGFIYLCQEILNKLYDVNKN